MDDSGTSPRYQIYLLRVWREQGLAAPHSAWRFSLEDTSTRQRHGFKSLEELTSFLATCLLPLVPKGDDET